MKKSYKNIFLKVLPVVFVLSLLSAVMTLTASADPYRQRIVSTEESCDILVKIEYTEKEPQNVMFISPSEEILDPAVTPTSKLDVYRGKGYVDYKIFDAEAGDWHIEYEQIEDGDARFAVVLSSRRPVIKSFTVDEIDGSDAYVSFNVTYGEGSARFGYNIAAYPSDSTSTYQLASGNEYSGEEIEKTLDLSRLASHDSYVLRLTVYADNGIAEVSDMTETKAFSYKNPNDVEPLENADITVDTSEKKVYIDWSEYFNNDSVFVEAFADGANKAIYFADMREYDAANTSFGYTDDCSELTVNIYVRSNNVLSEPFTKTFAVKDLPVEIDSQETSSNSEGVLRYDVDSEVKANIAVNNKKTTVLLEGNDTFTFHLADGNNKIEMDYVLDGVKYLVRSEAVVDKVAPVLEIYEDVDNKNVNSSDFTIIGKSEPGAVVTVNDKEAQVEEDGSFKYTTKLTEGENILSIKATDHVGNSYVRTVKILCNPPVSEKAAPKAQGGGYIPLVAALVLSSFVTLLLLVLVRKRSSRPIYKNNMPIGVYLLNFFSVVTIVLAFAALIMCGLIAIEYIKVSQKVNDAAAFSELALKNAIEAKDLLDSRKLCFILLIVSGVGGIVLAVVSTILKSMYRKKAPASSAVPETDKKAKKEKKEKIKKEKKEKTKKEKDKPTEGTVAEYVPETVTDVLTEMPTEPIPEPISPEPIAAETAFGTVGTSEISDPVAAEHVTVDATTEPSAETSEALEEHPAENKEEHPAPTTEETADPSLEATVTGILDTSDK